MVSKLLVKTSLMELKRLLHTLSNMDQLLLKSDSISLVDYQYKTTHKLKKPTFLDQLDMDSKRLSHIFFQLLKSELKSSEELKSKNNFTLKFNTSAI